MSVPGSSQALARRRSLLAVAVSVALHAAVVYAVNRVPWPARETSPMPVTTVVWLGERRLAAPERERPAPLPENTSPREVEPEPEPARAPDPESQPEPQPEPEPDPAPDPELELDPDPERRAADSEGASPAPEAEQSVRRRAYLAPGIDWEEERRRAVARALEGKDGYVTFSTEEAGDEDGAEAPNPRARLFDSPSRGRSAMQPGRARTRFGNWLADTCHGLTGGGFGFFGLSLCAGPQPTADFFADLRPAYLNQRPECAETDDAELSPLAIARRDEISSVKCRLVPREP